MCRCLNSRDPIKALEEFKTISEQQLNKLAELVRGDLTSLQRGTLMALVTIDVHARGIFYLIFTLLYVSLSLRRYCGFSA